MAIEKLNGLTPSGRERGTVRRDIAADKARVRKVISSAFGELDEHRAATKRVISRDDVTIRQTRETKRDRERRERKMRTGVIR
jgi:hypothetical protein